MTIHRMCQVEGCDEFVNEKDREEVFLFADAPDLSETIYVYRCSYCVEFNYITPEMNKSELDREREIGYEG